MRATEEMRIIGINLLKFGLCCTSQVEGIGGAQMDGHWQGGVTLAESRQDFGVHREPLKSPGRAIAVKLFQ